MTPVGNQGYVDSCVAFTISAALGALMVVEKVRPYPCDFSKQQLVDCVPIAPGGISFFQGFWEVCTHGLCLERDYGYEMKYNLSYKYDQMMRHATRSFIKGTFLHFRRLDFHQVHSCLERKPLAAAMFVYRSFSRHRAGLKSYHDLLGVYTPDEGEVMLTSNNGLPLGHAVLVIGFSRHPQPCYIIKNWSGVYWGCRGYARVAAHLLFDFNEIGTFRWKSD